MRQKPLCAHPRHQIPWTNKTTWGAGSKGNWDMGGNGSKVVGSIGIKQSHSSTHKSMAREIEKGNWLLVNSSDHIHNTKLDLEEKCTMELQEFMLDKNLITSNPKTRPSIMFKWTWSMH